MKIGLISDIHGNLSALGAILTELQAEAVDQVVCLGDVALFGPQPREVVACLRELACPVVMGNTDAWALAPAPFEARDEDSHRFYEVELWGARQLSDSDLAYVATFQPRIELPLGDGESLLGYHGSPRSNTDAILSPTPDDELQAMLSGCQAVVLAGGHTHAQTARRYAKSMLVNPGSTGLPYEQVPLTAGARNPPWAEVAVVAYQAGSLRVEFRRTPFDVSALTQAALDCGMPHADWWVRGWQ